MNRAMAEYTVKVAFWLRAFDGFTVEADSDDVAIAKAKAAALEMMESTAYPGHIDLDERREGVIAYIDQIAPDDHRVVADDVVFDSDRIHPAPGA